MLPLFLLSHFVGLKNKGYPQHKENHSSIIFIIKGFLFAYFLQELTLTGYDVNTGEELTELGHKIHYATHNGLPAEVGDHL